MKIEITIPVFNEEISIDQKIRQLNAYLDENLDSIGDISIIIADNGSSDRTEEKSKHLENALNRVKYLKLAERGVGVALKTSWLNSNADIVGYMDLDLATDLRHLKQALEKIISQKADIVSGSRLKSGAKVLGRSKVRSFTSFAFNKIVRIVFKTSFSDGMCGFKFLRRNMLNDLILYGARNNGWFFATEILIVGEFLRYKIYDLPVTWTDDPNSKVKINKLAFEYINQIIKLKIELSKNNRVL